MFDNGTKKTLQVVFDAALVAHTSTHLLIFLTDIEKSVGKERLIKKIYPKKDNEPTKRSTVILSLLKKICYTQVMDGCSNYQHIGVTASSYVDGDPSFGKDLKGSVDMNGDPIGEIRQFLLESGDVLNKSRIKGIILREILFRGSVQEAYGYELKPTKVHQNFINNMSAMNASDISAVYWTIKNELMCLFSCDFQLHNVHLKEMRDVITKTRLFFAGACVNFDRTSIAVAKKTHELFCLHDDVLNQQLYRLTIIKQKYRHPRRLFNVSAYAAACAFAIIKAEVVVFEKYNNCKFLFGEFFGIKQKRNNNFVTAWMYQRDGKLKSQQDENNAKNSFEELQSIMIPEFWSGHQSLCGVDVIQAMCTIAMKYQRDAAESNRNDEILTRVIRVPEID